MNSKQVVAMLTPEEKIIVEFSLRVSHIVISELARKLALEREKVHGLEQKLRKRNGNG